MQNGRSKIIQTYYDKININFQIQTYSNKLMFILKFESKDIDDNIKHLE